MENNSNNLDMIKNKLQYWASQLQDMGRRNHLLFFKDTKISSIIINEPNALEIFDRLVIKNKPIYAPQSKESQIGLFVELGDDIQEDDGAYQREDDEFLSNKKPDYVNRALSNLRYRTRTIKEEQGFNALYLGIGLLRWQEGIGGEYNEAPLILIPIDIDSEKLGRRLGIELLEDEIVVNPTLQTKLAKDFNIQLDDISNDITTKDLQIYLESVSRLMQKKVGIY